MAAFSLGLVGNPSDHFGEVSMKMRNLACAFVLTCCVLKPHSTMD